jgi:hypothetical protein
MTLDTAQLAVPEYVFMPRSIEQVLQLLAEEPGKKMWARFKATVANVRVTKARYMAFISFEMMERVLDSRLTALQAYKLIVLVLRL